MLETIRDILVSVAAALFILRSLADLALAMVDARAADSDHD